ncbi:molybdate transport repressor ModE-like protein [Serinibacter salmoneus]|uniref:Molybdate transport repressor ModE-like protein n=2 Tax=Serinibacter salmoneus TaxID=556530 RepID=A0A2A9D221_9MICO|nr:molybdate transport repressor ModE-like protein [Serinibacter salmoneus]
MCYVWGMADLDVTGLRLMQAIRDHGSITAAARALGVSQPAASQQAARLERRLGTALLDRQGRTVRLTEAGAALARHGETISGVLRAAEAEVASLAGMRSGVVRLVAFPSASATLVPAALAALRREHPELRVTLEEVEPPESLRLLRAGRADLALTFTFPDQPMPDGDAGLVTTDLLAEPTVVVLPEGHALAGEHEVDIADLAHEQWIAGCPRCRSHLMHQTESSGYTPQIAYATDDYAAVVGLVAAGLGVAMLPRLARHAAVSRPGVAVAQVRPAAPRTVQAVTTRDLLRVPAVAATVRALRAAADAVEES